MAKKGFCYVSIKIAIFIWSSYCNQVQIACARRCWKMTSTVEKTTTKTFPCHPPHSLEKVVVFSANDSSECRNLRVFHSFTSCCLCYSKVPSALTLGGRCSWGGMGGCFARLICLVRIGKKTAACSWFRTDATRWLSLVPCSFPVVFWSVPFSSQPAFKGYIFYQVPFKKKLTLIRA